MHAVGAVVSQRCGLGTAEQFNSTANASAADKIASVDRRYAYERSFARCLDHLALTDVDAEMVDRCPEKDQVAGLEIGLGHASSLVPLHLRLMRERDSHGLPGLLGQAGAVEAAVGHTFPGPEVRDAELRASEVDHLGGALMG